MNKKRLGIISAIATAVLAATALVVPSANAAGKSLVIWSND